MTGYKCVCMGITRKSFDNIIYKDYIIRISTDLIIIHCYIETFAGGVEIDLLCNHG